MKSYKRPERFFHRLASDLLCVHLYGPPVLGSSVILLPVDEEETSSTVAFMVVLASEKTVALNESKAVTPTTSKTTKITIDRSQHSFVRDELASRFFEQQPRRSYLVLEPILEVDEQPGGPTRWSILLRAHLGDTLLTSFSRRRVNHTPSLCRRREG